MTRDVPPWMTVDRPWLHVASGEADVYRESPDGGLVRVLDGRRMLSVDALFGEFSAALHFPDYFGENWAALDECIRDLSWLPAPSYRVVISAAASLLGEAELDRPTLLRILHDAGRSWADRIGLGPAWGGGRIPFNTVLVGAPVEWLASAR